MAMGALPPYPDSRKISFINLFVTNLKVTNKLMVTRNVLQKHVDSYSVDTVKPCDFGVH